MLGIMASVSLLRKKSVGVQCTLLSLSEVQPESKLTLNSARLSGAGLFYENQPTSTFKSVSTQFSTQDVQSLPVDKKSKATQCCFQMCKLIRVNTAPPKPAVAEKSVQVNVNNSKQSIGLDSKFNLLRSIEEHLEKVQEQGLQYELKQDFKDDYFIYVTKDKVNGLLGRGVEPITLTIDANGHGVLSILFKEVEQFSIFDASGHLNADVLNEYILKISNKSLKVFCPGILTENIELNGNIEENSFITRFKYPYLRHQSIKCEVLYLPEKPTKVLLKQCKNCKYATNYISKIRKRKIAETPTRKYKRLHI